MIVKEPDNLCVICGAVIPEGRQVCPICGTKDEVESYAKLIRTDLPKKEHPLAKAAVETALKIKGECEQAFRQGYEEGIRQLESKYWDSQRLIDQYAAENKRMKFLLRELLMNQRKNCSDCNVEMLSEECKKRPDGNTCFKSKYFDEVMELINE